MITALVVDDGFPTSLTGEKVVEVVRIVQEALTNVRRHSKARRASVALGSDGENIRVAVADDGTGLGPSSPRGVGILGMKERTRTLGGHLEIESREGSGTRVRLTFSEASLARDPENQVNI